jgi:FkbM family methyltransferase
MKISPRAFLHRLVTYPLLVPIMPLYNLSTDKKPVLDAFYFVRGFPHGYLKDGKRIASYNGLKIAFPFEEDPSFDDVWLRNVYYPYQPRRDDVVIDVGAHMGFFTLKIVREVARVVAVEPDPTNFKFLAYNTISNGLERKVTLMNLSLGDHEGSIFLDRGGYGFGRSRTVANDTGYAVKLKTLDNIVKAIGVRHVELIKIDTEGNELEVLKGAEETLEVYQPDILLASYHFYREWTILADYLKDHGYNVLWYNVPLFLSSKREVYLYASLQVRFMATRTCVTP